MIKLYLFDIEGTTTDIRFVHTVLFPYSRTQLPEFVRNHHHEETIAAAVSDVQATVLKEEGRTVDLDGAIAKLLQWIDEDRKHGALKEIQGHIWDLGYSRNDFQGHVYDDVAPSFLRILDSGATVGIYSSGSVHAQKLIFGFSTAGDLTPLIAHYFDTKIGGKRERTSYTNIATATHLSPGEIRFFSDIPQELEAARSAGMSVTHVVRPGTQASDFPSIADFTGLPTR